MTGDAIEQWDPESFASDEKLCQMVALALRGASSSVSDHDQARRALSELEQRLVLRSRWKAIG